MIAMASSVTDLNNHVVEAKILPHENNSLRSNSETQFSK
nr:Putative uncharacterized protein [Moritella viscosa]